MKQILLGLVLLSFISAKAQIVELEKDVDAQMKQTKFGKNRTHYVHFFMSLGMVAGKPEKKASAIEYGNSTLFDFGFRYKLKICNFYALGADLSSSYITYALKQTAEKNLPNSVIHDEESLQTAGLNLGIYNRFNFGKRGDHIGRFIDLGGYGNWLYQREHFTRDKLPNGTIQRVSISRLTFMQKTDYGVLVRLGLNQWVLFGKYRFSDLFTPESGYYELPRMIFGLEIGFF